MSHPSLPWKHTLVAVLTLIALTAFAPLTGEAKPKATPTPGAGSNLPGGAIVTLTADQTAVKAGDPVNLSIHLKNVKDASFQLWTLNVPTVSINTLDPNKGKDTRLSETERPCLSTRYELHATLLKTGAAISRTATVNVTGYCAPDLAVGDITSNLLPDPNNANHMLVEFVVPYSNKGSAGAPAVAVTAKYNATGGSTVTGKTLPLDAGGESEMHFTEMSLPKGQVLTFVVTLDPANTLSELDKTNNSKSYSLSIQ